MSEGGDDEDKTEEPSAKKQREAREKGQVAQSKEVNTWVILFTATMLIGIMGNGVASKLSGLVINFIAMPQTYSLDPHGLAVLLGRLSLGVAAIIGFPLCVFFLAAGLSSFIQIGPMLSGESLKPSFDKINPMKGFKKVFGQRAAIEFVKAFIKMVLVGVVTTIVLMPIFDRAPGMVGIFPGDMMAEIDYIAHKLLVATLVVLFVFAALDYGMQWYQLRKQLMMSRQELKDEYKQTEGDPHIKGKIRQLRVDRARKRMMAKVPNASVIITNPTHYAIAMEYNTDKNGAPVVVAMGVDNIALRIREVAKQHNVPIVENPPLARAMYDSVELDQEIPEQHYKAVAEIISYVFALKNR